MVKRLKTKNEELQKTIIDAKNDKGKSVLLYQII